ncbi:hypothetical protein V2K79_04550 [Pseudomonas alliivorans]|nr:hypothetical protein [Pseudomonas alliivorans]
MRNGAGKKRPFLLAEFSRSGKNTFGDDDYSARTGKSEKHDRPEAVTDFHLQCWYETRLDERLAQQ